MPPSLIKHRTYLREQAQKLKPDSWVAVHSPVNPWKMHALGLIQFYWTGCEYWLTALFAAVAGWPEREAWIMLHDNGDVAITAKLEAIMDLRPLSAVEKSAIGDALAIYDLCRLNRNQLTHYSITDSPGGDDALRLIRRSRKPQNMFGSPMNDDLWTIRRVANDARRLRAHLMALAMYFLSRKMGAVATLPRRPPSPQTLWTPAPQAPSARKRQPQSSQALPLGKKQSSVQKRAAASAEQKPLDWKPGE